VRLSYRLKEDMRDTCPSCDSHHSTKKIYISYTTTPPPPKDLMSADSYVMCYFKANIQFYFVNVSVQRRKAVCLGCVVYLDELVIIGLGTRLRQGFEGEGLRIGYKPDDRSHPKIKQKKSLEDFSSKLSL